MIPKSLSPLGLGATSQELPTGILQVNTITDIPAGTTGIAQLANGDIVSASTNGITSLRNKTPIYPIKIASVLPAIVTGTVSSLAGLFLPAISGNSSYGADYETHPNWSYSRASPTVSNGTTPGFSNILGDTASGPISSVVRISFYYTGSAFELWFGASSNSYKMAVDNDWLSDTAQSVGSGGGNFYAKYTFSTATRRRIDIDIPNPSFYGLTIETTGSIESAPIRGPRIIAITDSFGQSGPTTMIDYAGAALQIDDFWTSFVASTGYIANANGTKKTFRQRLAIDVFPYNPSIVLICGSVNDDTQTYADLYAEAIALYTAIRVGLPQATIVVCGSASRGAGTWMTAGDSNKIWCNYAKRNACAALGIPYLDFMDNGLPGLQTVNVLKVAIATGVNTSGTGGVSVIQQVYSLDKTGAVSGDRFNWPRVGNTYAIRKGTATEERFVVTKITGLTNTLSQIETDGVLRFDIASSDTITQVGNCPFTGRGHIGAVTGWGNADITSSDGTHPSALGHSIYGGWLANKLSTLGII